jgi:serine/threonine protein kinase
MLKSGNTEGIILSYFVMPRYGQNFEQYYDYLGKQLSDISIYELGKKVIKILRVVHEAGYAYNDLKLDNLLVGFNQ